MKTLDLIRLSTGADGTFGVLLDQGIPFAITLEEEWLYNARDISCIPEGYYTCERIVSPKFGDTFEVKKVQGRSSILFHKGNTEINTQGCILIGESFGKLWALDDEKGTKEMQPAILQSWKGFAEFMDKFKLVDSFIIQISWYKPERLNYNEV